MDTECPYCEKELNINHDDGSGYEEDVRHEIECPHCEKTFVFTTFILFCYESAKADCLNGEEHVYKITKTIPNEFSKMECTMCGKRRELSDDERTKFDIGTKESYLDKIKL